MRAQGDGGLSMSSDEKRGKDWVRVRGGTCVTVARHAGECIIGKRCSSGYDAEEGLEGDAKLRISGRQGW